MPRTSPLVPFAAVLALPLAAQHADAPRPSAWVRAGDAPSFQRERREAWAADDTAWTAAHGRLLAWLAARQREDGHVPAGAEPAPVADVGATALAVLALHSGGSTMRVGPHRNEVKKAVIWLKNRQQESGWLVASDDPSGPLVQALAAVALVQTHVDSQYALLHDAARRALLAVAASAGPDRAVAEPVVLALAAVGARHLPAHGEELANAALPALAKQLRAEGVVAGAAGAFPHEGPAGATPELATFVVVLASAGTAAMPADAPALRRVAERFAALPARLGGNGELLDGLLLWSATDVAFDLGGDAWRTMRWQLEQRVLPRLAPPAADAPPAGITFACGPRVLRNEAAESALVALALAVPWYRVGR